MASVKGMYGGNYMVADDLSNDPHTYEILSAYVEKKFARIALRLSETGKVLMLNKTNARAIAATVGDDTDKWQGTKIVVKREPVTYMGDQVDGIRVVSVVRAE